MKYFIILCIALLFAVSDISGTALAAEDSSTVSILAVPSILDIGGKPGDEIPFKFAVTNKSRLVLPFRLSARPMLGMEGETNTFLLKNDAQGWIRFDEPDFLLDAGKTKEITGKLAIPSDAGPEGFYADILVRPLGQRDSSGSVHAQPELAVRVLARVSGKANEKVTVRMEGGAFVLAHAATKRRLEFTLKNSGNVHELVRPLLRYTESGRDVDLIESEPLVLLPRESRRVSFEIPSDLGAGLYDAKILYDYGTPIRKVNNIGYRVLILPFAPAIFLIIPAGIVGYISFRYRDRFQKAIGILTKGGKAGK